MQGFWTEERLNRTAIAVALGLSAALFLSIFVVQYPVSMLNAGDFPGFYVQALLLKLGKAADLYNFELQRQLENEHWPLFNGLYYPSAYPPFTALMLYPLAYFSHQAAQNIFLILMLVSYFLSFWNLRAINRTLGDRRASLGIIMLLFAPLFCGIFASQNTGLSLLLLSSAIRCSQSHSKSVRFLGGLITAAWFFKPQYGLLLLMASICISVDLALIIGAATGAVLLWCVTAWYFGARWIQWWVSSISFFDSLNLSVNAKEAVSVRGALTSLGADTGTGWMVTGLLIAALMSLLLLRRKKMSAINLYGFFLALVPLVSPQTLFYDLSIALYGLFLVVDFKTDRTIWIMWTLIGLGAASFMGRESGFITPFLPIAILIAGATTYEVFRPQSRG